MIRFIVHSLILIYNYAYLFAELSSFDIRVYIINIISLNKYSNIHLSNFESAPNNQYSKISKLV